MPVCCVWFGSLGVGEGFRITSSVSEKPPFFFLWLCWSLALLFSSSSYSSYAIHHSTTHTDIQARTASMRA